MTRKAYTTVAFLTLVGMVLGALLGYLVPGFMAAISVVGDLFMRALHLLVAPLVISAIIAAIASLRDHRRLGRPLVTVLVYFAGTTVIAVGIGLALALALVPGWEVSSTGVFVHREAAQLQQLGVADILRSLLPTNLPRAVIEGQYLGIIIFSLFFGGALLTLGHKGRLVADFFRTVRDVVLRLAYVILYAAPVGMFSLVGTLVATNHLSAPGLGGNLLYFTLALGAGLVIQAVIVLPLILRLIGRRLPLGYAGNMIPALFTAFGTGSSAVAYPVTYAGVVDRNRIDSRAASLALPLGMTMNLNGTALQITLGAIFIAQMFGLSLSVGQVITMAAVAALASLGAAAIPYAGVFLTVLVLRAGGFPAEAYAGVGFLVVISWLFQRFAVLVDVWGDAVGAAVTERSFGRVTSRKPAAVSRPAARREVSRESGTRPRSDRRAGRTGRRETRPGSEKGRTRQRSGERGQRSRSAADTARERRADRPSRQTRRPSPASARRTSFPGERPGSPRTESVKADADRERISVPPSVEAGKARPRHDEPAPAAPEQRTDVTKTETAERQRHERVTERETGFDHAAGADADQAGAPVEERTSSESVDKVAAPSLSNTPEYGRMKERRGRVAKEPKSSQDGPDDDAPQEEYSLDDMKFGRQKRKRVR